jgi:hypothetical protein
MALQLDADGWTLFPLHPDARRIYVSKAGSDSNDGLSESTPKLTVAAGKALLRPGFGDHLLFRRGDTWTSENFGGMGISGVRLSGHSEDYPCVIGAYGDVTQPRPIFDTVGNTWIFRTGADGTGTCAHIAIVHLDGFGRSDEGSYTTIFFINLLEQIANLTIEGCRAKWYLQGIVMSNATLNTFQNVRLRRNVVVESYAVNAEHSQGFYVSGATGLLLEDNYVDEVTQVARSGSTADTQFRHGYYIQTNCLNVTYRNNWASRCSAQGHSVRAPAHVYRNSTFECPIGITAVGAPSGDPNIVEENVIVDSREAVYGSAASWAISLSENTVAGCESRYNLVKGWTKGPTSIKGLQIQGCAGVAIHHNKFYDYPEVGDWFGNTANCPFYSNDVQSKTVSTSWRLVSEGGDWFQSQANNRYWRQGGDSNWFRRNDTPRTFAQYTSEKSDTTSVVEEVAYPDPSRDYARFWTEVCGGSSAMTGLLAAIRDQRLGNWDSRIQPKYMNNWIAAGFDMSIGEALPSSGSESNAKRTRLTVSIGVGL